MKSKKLIATLLTLSIVSSLAIVGCDKKDDSSSTSTTPTTETKDDGPKMDKDQYLNVFLQSEPKSLDASRSSDSVSSEVLTNVMESLTRIGKDKDGKDIINPGGAEKWDISDDKLTWTFHLRDFKWSDGKAVSAKDYEYSIKRSLNPKTASEYAFLLAPIKNANEYNSGKGKVEDVGVKATDDKTLEITLKGPCPYFLDLTYFKLMAPQRQDIVEKAGDKYGTESDTLVFCGPFIIKNWAHQSKIELEKNPNYWDAAKVNLNKVTMNIIKEEPSRLNSMLNGALDIASANKPEWKKKLDATGNFDFIKNTEPGVNYVSYNHKDRYFKNAKVRKAFTLAYNRADATKVLFNDLFTPAYAWCPPSLQLNGDEFRKQAASDPIKKLQEENPDPKALLIEGLKELGENPDPSKMDVTSLQSGTSARDREFAEFDQQMYKKALGINVKAEYTEWPIFQKRTKNFEFQLSGSAWTGDYNDPMTFFDMWKTGAGVTNTGYTSPKYDDLITKAQNSSDQAERLSLFKDAENVILYEDCAFCPTLYRAKSTYKRKFVKNYCRPLFGVPDYKETYTEGRQ